MTEDLQKERIDLAAAFHLAARFNYHEAVANHFSLAVNDDGSRFLINPNQCHFSLIKASDLLLIDANDVDTLNNDDAPDPTAWGLHGAVHRHCAHARCVLHTHATYSTVLACLEDPALPPIDQNCAQFFERTVIDKNYGGMAFEDEGERCAALLNDPSKRVMIMGNHGVLILGDSVADAFDRLYYFERSAETYIKALQTGRPINVLSPEVAEKTARQWEEYDDAAAKHFSDLKILLDRDDADYRL